MATKATKIVVAVVDPVSYKRYSMISNKQVKRFTVDGLKGKKGGLTQWAIRHGNST